MIGKSLFIGEHIELTALDVEKDSSTISSWTKNLEFSKCFMEGIARQYAVYEIKKKLKEKLKESDEKRNDYYFGVRKKSETELIGIIHFGGILPSHQVSNLMMNFGFAQDFRTYGSELLKLALRYAFMELSLHRLGVEISSQNTDEIQLFENSGFTKDVIRREASFYNGQYVDLYVYSLLKPEWKRMQNEVNQ